MEKILESPLDSEEIQPVHPKGHQSWIFTGRTDGEAETPILWPSDAKYWLTGKDPDAGKDWRQEEKGMTEDEMVIADRGLIFRWRRSHVVFLQLPRDSRITMGTPVLLPRKLDRGAWWATVHGLARVRHDLAAKHHHHKQQNLQLLTSANM